MGVMWKLAASNAQKVVFPKAPLDEAPKRVWTYDKREEKWLKVGPRSSIEENHDPPPTNLKFSLLRIRLLLGTSL